MGLKKFIEDQFDNHFARSSVIVSAILIGTIIEVGSFIETGYWNPIKQGEYYNSKKIEEKKNKTKYDSLYKQFTKLADINNDGYISFTEQVDAWKRMEQKGPFFQLRGTSQFSKPTMDELEKAIVSYKQK